MAFVNFYPKHMVDSFALKSVETDGEKKNLVQSVGSTEPKKNADCNCK